MRTPPEHLWAKVFDRALDDVFAIQSEVAEQSAGALRLALLGPERDLIRRKLTSNLEAYELYLRGVHAFHFPGTATFEEVVVYFEGAIRIDPGFSQAHA